MRGLARVAFIALQPTIETELAAGWTAKAIYQRHAADLTNISYPQFVRYARRLKKPLPVTASASETKGQPTSVTAKRTTGFASHTGNADPAILRKLTSG